MGLSWLKIGVICLTLTTTLACESKFQEKSPDDGSNAGTLSLQDRMSNKRSLDQKLHDIENLAVKTKQITELFRKNQKQPDGSVYTPIDLLADISRELQKGIPDSISGEYEKDGELTLPFISLSADCQVVNARFKTVGTPDPTADQIDAPSPHDHAVISLSTCNTNGEYIDTFVLDGQGGYFTSLNVVNGALDKLFAINQPGGALDKIRDACQFNQDSSGEVTTMTCKNLSIQINGIHEAVLDSLTFNLNSNVRLEASGKIYEQGVAILTTYVKLTPTALPVVNFGAVEQTPPPQTQASQNPAPSGAN